MLAPGRLPRQFRAFRYAARTILKALLVELEAKLEEVEGQPKAVECMSGCFPPHRHPIRNQKKRGRAPRKKSGMEEQEGGGGGGGCGGGGGYGRP